MPEIVFNTRGAESVGKAHDQIDARNQKTQKNYRQTAQEAQKLGRLEQKIIRDTETARERYNRQLRETRQALAGHARETELVRRAETQLKLEYARSADANKRLAAEKKQSSEQVLQQSLKELGRIKDVRKEYTRFGPVLKNHATGLQKIHEANLKTFGPGAVSRLQKFRDLMGGLGGMATAYAGYQMLQGAANYGSGVGQRAIQSARAGGALAELALGDPRELDKLYQASHANFREGGFESLDDAHRLTFELASGDMLGERSFYSRLQQSGSDAAQIAKNVSLVRAGFHGGDAVGTSEELISKAARVAAAAPGAEVEDVLAGLAQVSGTAKQLGVTDEEVLALMGNIAKVTGSGKEAGQRTEALFRAFIRRGYVDNPVEGGLQGLLEELAGKNFKPSELQEELGRQEAAFAFAIGKDIPAYQQALADVTAAQSQGLATKIVESSIARPEVANRRYALATRAEGELAASGHGFRRTRIEGELDQATGTLYETLNPAAAFILDKLMRLGETLTPDALNDPGTDVDQNPWTRGIIGRLLGLGPAAAGEAPESGGGFQHPESWQEAADRIDDLKRQEKGTGDQAARQREQTNRLLAAIARKPGGLLVGNT